MIKKLIRNFEKRRLYRTYPYHWNYRFGFVDGMEEIPYLVSGVQQAAFFQSLAEDPVSEVFVCFNGARRVGLDWTEITRHIPEGSFLLIDYPGGGLNPEIPGRCLNSFEEVVMESAKKAVEKLKRLGKLKKDAAVKSVGFSLGCGFAARFAAEMNADHLMLLAPFETLERIARLKKSKLATWFGKFGVLETERWLFEYAEQNQAKIDIIHGTEDSTVPFFMGENLAKSAAAFMPGDEAERLSRLNFHALEGNEHDLLAQPAVVELIKKQVGMSG